MADKIFIDGMIIKSPSERAPEYVKANISVKVFDFTNFARKHAKNGWLNIDLKKSTQGRLYLELNTFEPKGRDQRREEEITAPDYPMPDIEEELPPLPWENEK